MDRIKNRSTGFTLIEVVIAVAILSSALITLLGLQSAAVERTVRDRNMQKAMFIARSILSAIESSKDEIQPMKKSGPALDVLGSVGIVDKLDEGEEEELNLFLADLTIEPWGLPNIDPEATKRITLDVYWSENPRDTFHIVYFVPKEENS